MQNSNEWYSSDAARTIRRPQVFRRERPARGRRWRADHSLRSASCCHACDHDRQGRDDDADRQRGHRGLDWHLWCVLSSVTPVERRRCGGCRHRKQRYRRRDRRPEYGRRRSLGTDDATQYPTEAGNTTAYAMVGTMSNDALPESNPLIGTAANSKSPSQGRRVQLATQLPAARAATPTTTTHHEPSLHARPLTKAAATPNPAHTTQTHAFGSQLLFARLIIQTLQGAAFKRYTAPW